MLDCEPLEWFVVFHRETSRPWVKWLAWGRYQHVSAFAYYKSARVWVFFDVMICRTRLLIVSDEKADALIGHYARQGLVVRMMAPIPADDRTKLKIGFWCVPAVAHLLGLKGCALRPDALLRQCLANGGTVAAKDDVDERTRGRSRAEASARGSGDGQDRRHSGARKLADFAVHAAFRVPLGYVRRIWRAAADRQLTWPTRRT